MEFDKGTGEIYLLWKAFEVIIIATQVLVSLEDIHLEHTTVPVGVIWALAGAVLYACYMVFLKRKVPSEDQMDFTMFFGKSGFKIAS